MEKLTMSQALGERWDYVQRTLGDAKLRNCLVEDATFSDIDLIAKVLECSVHDVIGMITDSGKKMMLQYAEYLNNGGTMSFVEWWKDGRNDSGYEKES